VNTLLMCNGGFASVKAAIEWANSQPGRTAPTSDTFEITKIIQFQVVPEGDGFSVALLVEAERKKSMSSMVINMRKDLGFAPEE